MEQIIVVHRALFPVVPPVISFSPYNKLTEWVELSPFYRWASWGSSRWRHLPRVTQGTCGRTRVSLTAGLWNCVAQRPNQSRPPWQRVWRRGEGAETQGAPSSALGVEVLWGVPPWLCWFQGVTSESWKNLLWLCFLLLQGHAQLEFGRHQYCFHLFLGFWNRKRSHVNWECSEARLGRCGGNFWLSPNIHSPLLLLIIEPPNCWGTGLPEKRLHFPASLCSSGVTMWLSSAQ